jgi:Cytochrome P460
MKFHHLLAVGVLTAPSLAADDPARITAEKVRESYKTFTRVTKEPKSVGAEFAGGCLPSPEMDQMVKETGPHALHYLHYYLNDLAKRHRDARSDGAYPTGSVIVKEKLFDEPFSRDSKLILTGVAGMIKRKPGSSPANGDWEFFYFSNASLSKDGKAGALGKAKDLKSCVSCHSNAAEMVFGRFDEPYVMPKAREAGKALKLEVAPADGLQLGPKK